MTKRHFLTLSIALLLLFSFSCSLFQFSTDEETATPEPEAVTQPTDIPEDTDQVEKQPPTPAPESDLGTTTLPRFANYQVPDLKIIPAVIQEPIAQDLSNVRNSYILSQGLRQRLGETGFVIAPGTEKEFFTIYEKARYANQPVFITSDSLLHVYHLLFDKVLRTAEVQYFIPMLHDLNAAMLTQVDAQYADLQGSAWQDPALRTVAFVGVASKLLDLNVQVPAYAQDLVEAELALIEAASGIQPSPLFPGLEFGEDYTQYIPRGHYTRSEDLSRYFKSMMWYGRMTFRLKTDDPEVGKTETRAALLLVQALKNANVNGKPALDVWQDLFSPTAFMVGRSDDLTVLQYLDVMAAVYGSQPSLADLVDEAQLETFIQAAYQLPPPRILGLVIMDTDDVEETTKGLRFMGQRFVPDAYVFRQLIYRNVGTREDPRPLPNGLDIPAAMGSERAYQLLEQMGQTQYLNYPEQMEKMKTWLSTLSTDEWTETLYNTWLYNFYPLLKLPGQGYPVFMQSTSWLDKQLNTVLGSFAELKHDTILYAKQVYAELGGGPPPPPPEPPKGYVEPVPEFYARLAALTDMTRQGLGDRGLLDEIDRNSLDILHTLVLSMQTIAEKELHMEPLTEDEYATIRFYGGQLEELTMAAADSDMEDPYARRYMEEEPQAAVIADIATDPASASVLEIGVGRINPIYAVVPVVEADGSTYLQVAKGGTFSYYEFSQPMSDRLTDEKWHTMLDEGNAPTLPTWTDSFLVDEVEYEELSRAIFDFQGKVTNAYWYNQFEYLPGSGAGIDQIKDEVRDLQAQRRYIGHRLLASQVRSFDIQSPTLAVVTTRETWQDTLYAATSDFPDLGDAILGQRGPYIRSATYTLEWNETEYGGLWEVAGVVYAEEPPAFE